MYYKGLRVPKALKDHLENAGLDPSEMTKNHIYQEARWVIKRYEEMRVLGLMEFGGSTGYCEYNTRNIEAVRNFSNNLVVSK